MEGKKTAVVGEGHSLIYFIGAQAHSEYFRPYYTIIYLDVFIADLRVLLTGRRLPPPPPPPLRVAKTGENNLNEEITPLLPTGIGERFSQTISNLGHAALLCHCELPL
jgi:hypothetical protein